MESLYLWVYTLVTILRVVFLWGLQGKRQEMVKYGLLIRRSQVRILPGALINTIKRGFSNG